LVVVVVERFDREAVAEDAGVRAVWLLYRRGKWGFLEDFGIERRTAEREFKKFEATHVLGDRLTRVQIRRLAKVIPGLVDAVVELRLAYIFRFATDKELEALEL